MARSLCLSLAAPTATDVDYVVSGTCEGRSGHWLSIESRCVGTLMVPVKQEMATHHGLCDTRRVRCFSWK